MKNKRGLAFIPLLIIFGVMIVLVFIIVKNPEFCIPALAGQNLCYRIVPLRISQAILFWVAFISFFLIQAGLIYIYYMAISKSWTYVNKFISYLKKASMDIEKYFIKLSY